MAGDDTVCQQEMENESPRLVFARVSLALPILCHSKSEEEEEEGAHAEAMVVMSARTCPSSPVTSRRTSEFQHIAQGFVN